MITCDKCGQEFRAARILNTPEYEAYYLAQTGKECDDLHVWAHPDGFYGCTIPDEEYPDETPERERVAWLVQDEQLQRILSDHAEVLGSHVCSEPDFYHDDVIYTGKCKSGDEFPCEPFCVAMALKKKLRLLRIRERQIVELARTGELENPSDADWLRRQVEAAEAKEHAEEPLAPGLVRPRFSTTLLHRIRSTRKKTP